MAVPVALQAQSGPTEEGTSFWGRFSAGGRLSVLGLSPYRTDSFVHGTNDPAVRTSRATDWTAGRFGFAATTQFQMHRRVSLGVDLVFRKTGYNGSEEIVRGEDNLATVNADERKVTTITEETRVEYWELPILLRYHFAHRSTASFQRYFGAGVAFRRAGHVRTSRQITLPDDDNDDTNETSIDKTRIPIANRTVPGLVVAAGVQLTDDLGIKVTPEIRYTHWLRDTISLAPPRSNQHQVEFVIGFRF